MRETVFTLKAGTEVPKQFDGITVPINAPASNAEMLELAGDNAFVIFNRAYVLDVQKAVKVEAQKDGATVEKLRAVPANFKIGDPKTRAANGTGKPRVAAKAVSQVLGDDFLSMLTPEQRAKYDEKMAALSAKPATPAATATEPTPAATEAPKVETPAPKGRGK